jgi:hypothetical protein
VEYQLGVPLVSHQGILQPIAATTAKIGRAVRTRSGDVPAGAKDGAYVMFKAAM